MSVTIARCRPQQITSPRYVFQAAAHHEMMGNHRLPTEQVGTRWFRVVPTYVLPKHCFVHHFTSKCTNDLSRHSIISFHTLRPYMPDKRHKVLVASILSHEPDSTNLQATHKVLQHHFSLRAHGEMWQCYCATNVSSMELWSQAQHL